MYEKAIVILGVSLTCAGGLNAADVILNEYNAVGNNQFLEDGAADTYWGRVLGNGGDWFELVVITDHLDMHNWDLVISDDTGGVDEYIEVLALTDDPIWFNLRCGTIITVSEDLPDDVSYDPANGDWWINVQASNDADGTYITDSNFRVSDAQWQLTIKDDSGAVVFGPAGEGIQPAAGVIAEEVCKLEEDPSASITPSSNYRDGQSSTFGSPNIWQRGAHSQDFSDLWDVIKQCTSDTECDDGEYCNGLEACDTNGACQSGTDPCPDQMCDDDNDVCADCLSDDHCEDGLFCTGSETCAGGWCVHVSPPCLGQMCRESDHACVECLADGDCDDALYCDGAETCDANGNCQPGTEPCAGRLCDEDADGCFEQGCSTDGDCDDALYCNGLETCVDGSCQAGTHVDCDDGVSCTDDSCDEGADSCDNTPGNANCDNGLFCDGAETCHTLLGCQAGSDPCPGQTCDEEADLCTDCLSNGDCNDGEFCNGAETCQGGVCTDGDHPCADLGHCDELDDVCLACIAKGECNDGSPCTDDACVDNVCLNTAVPDDTPCSDGEFCNGDETCQDGVCTDGDQPCADLDHCDEVNAGCDDDGDGVVNPLDECADTPAGTKVDDTGCTITLTEEPAGAESPTSDNGDNGDTDTPPSNGQDAGGSGSGGGSGSCGVIGLVNLAFIFMGLVAVRFARRSRA